ncbi:cold shock domain-containing protein [Enterobacter sp. J706]|uniref:cold shock domain-containing protein n=1 Tax=Enterobacter sp. J706 TaxID=3444321 RepID=UPI003EBE9AEF
MVQWSPYFNTAGEVRYDILSVKGLIIPSERRKDVLLHISAVNSRESELLLSGRRIEFCRINGLRGPVAANIYLF